MGRRRFRLADMMPNSWFYKLRDMRRPRQGHPPAVGGSAVLPSSPPPLQRGARSVTRPASPRRGSLAALPHRTSYYYPTRDRRELPAPEPRNAATEEEDRHRQLQVIPQQQSLLSCSRRRHRVGAPVRAGRVPEALAGAHDDAQQSRRRRDMYVDVGRDGSDEDDEVRRPAAATTAASDYSVSCKVIASETDIVIDLCSEVVTTGDERQRVLRPIVTRPAMREVVRYEVKDRGHVDVADTTPAAAAGGGSCSASEQGSNKAHPRRPSSVSVGRRLRTRVNSPRLSSSASAASRSRKSISKPTTPGAAAASPRKTTTTPAPPPRAVAESFAVVKSSADPRRDFRESMEEMIVEKGIRGAGDLEDLLACYLALNADEHHELIVEVFEEIWASLSSLAAGANP